MDPVSQPDNDIPPPFSVLLRRLLDDIAAYFNAERQVYDIQVKLTRRSLGWAALCALGAVVVAQGAMIALVVGMLLSLAAVMGAAKATAIVVGLCFVSAAIFVYLIRMRFRSVKLAWRRRYDR